MTLVFCLCSVLSKEQGITVVAVCVTYEFFILYKVNGFTRPHPLLQSEKGYRLALSPGSSFREEEPGNEARMLLG